MASDPRFLNLPPELICRIFECAADFSVVATLAQTANPFYRVWRKFPTSIYRAVAPRALFALDDAERLLDVQEQAEAMYKSHDSLEQKSIIRTKRLLLNARCASTITDHWIEICEWETSSDQQHGPMKPSEIERFQQSLYSVWAIGVMGTTPHLQHKATAFLDKCSLRKLRRLDEFASYAVFHNKNYFGTFGLYFRNDVWRTGWDLVSERCMVVDQEGRHFWLVEELRLELSAFFDENQKRLGTMDDESEQ